MEISKALIPWPKAISIFRVYTVVPSVLIYFSSNLSSMEHNHVGSLFYKEEQKRVGSWQCMLVSHVQAFFVLSNTENSRQNGSAHSHVSTTFKLPFLTIYTINWLKTCCECCYCFCFVLLLLILTGPVMLHCLWHPWIFHALLHCKQ